MSAFHPIVVGRAGLINALRANDSPLTRYMEVEL